MIPALSRRAMIASLAGATLLSRHALAVARGAVEEVVLVTAGGRPVTTTWWRAPARRGTILFSHGALSSPGKYTVLIERWVAAGFDVWAPLHVDSTDHPDTAKFPGLASWAARIEDMRALAGHAGSARYVAAGHSYGALVALTLGGASPARPAGITGALRDPRACAAVAFSPPGPGMGLIDAAGYATLAVPALIETGTADIPPGASAPEGWRGHLAAWEAAAQGGDRYALVLDGADHYFGGLVCRPELPGPKQQPQFDQALMRSVEFLRGYGLADAGTRRRLRNIAVAGPARGPGLYRR